MVNGVNGQLLENVAKLVEEEQRNEHDHVTVQNHKTEEETVKDLPFKKQNATLSSVLVYGVHGQATEHVVSHVT